MDLQGFIGEITGETADDDTVTVYRGHPNSTYRLKPTIFRTAAQAENEHLLLRDLVAMHPDQFAADGSAMEMLVRMQHYSLPTRLLDATWNPLVALYFASLSKKRRVLKRGTKERVRPVHDRMPVLLHRDEYDQWLNGGFDDVVALQERCFPDGLIHMDRTAEPWTKRKPVGPTPLI